MQISQYFGSQSTFWAKIGAMSVLGTLPVFVAVAMLQRYLGARHLDGRGQGLSMSGLSITGVHKPYGAVHAVRGIDLDIPSGEFIVLVGPSGCGKTTLLRTIAGLEEITAGTIALGGRDIHDARPRDRNIAMVFQNYALYPFLTVFENIAFGLRARRTPKAEIDARVRRAADMLDISGCSSAIRASSPAASASGSRSAARSCATQSSSCSTSRCRNLDAQLRDEMRGEIKRLHQRLGKTMIYVTHDQIEAMTLADRVVLMRNGAIEQQGAPLDLFERPATRFVAGFLGSPRMNFVPCPARPGRRTASRWLSPTTPACRSTSRGRRAFAPSRVASWSSASARSTCTAGCRRRRRRATDRSTARIELVQPTGTRTFVQFPFAGVDVTAELPAHAVERPGAVIELLIDLGRSILIDPATDRACRK